MSSIMRRRTTAWPESCLLSAWRRTGPLRILVAVCLVLGLGAVLGGCSHESLKPSDAAAGPEERGEKLLRVGTTASEPVIDGVLDDACWRDATLASGFVSITGEWVEEQTTAFATYDDTNLYLAFYCNERFPDKLRAGTPSNDFQALMFHDDLVEFFLDTDHDQATYYHFAVNPAGIRYDAFCSVGGATPVRKNDWNPEWDVKTRVGTDHWIVEARVPFASLGRTRPVPGETWGINLNRSRWAGGMMECSSWAMIRDGFNQPGKFGTMVFGAAADVSYSIVSMREHRTDSDVRIRLRNGKTSPVTAETEWSVTAPGGGKSSRAQRTRLGPREEKEIDFTYDVADGQMKDVPLGAPGYAEVSLRVANAGTGETYGSRQGTVKAHPPLDMSIDRYYYPSDVPKMEVRLSRRTRNGAQMEVEVRRDMRSKPVAAARIRLVPDTHDYVAAFDIAQWEPGRYIISARLVGDDGGTLASIHRVVIKRDLAAASGVPPKDARVSIGANGIMLLDGKPFCPFLASETDATSPLAGEAFNVRQGEVGLMPGALDHLNVELPWVTREGADTFVLLPDEETMYRKLREKVEARKSDPSVFCWLLKYEAQIPMFRGEPDRARVDNVAELTRVNAFVKSLAPGQLTSVQVDKPESIEAYRGIADIVEVAMPGSSYEVELIPRLVEDVKEARRLVGAEKPLLYWIGSSVPSPQERTAEEIRCAAYLALMHGADGLVFHMGHGGIDPSYTRHWSVYPGLAREVETLFRALAAPQSEASPLIRVDAGEVVLCTRRYQQRLYLVAVNTSPRTVAATFTLMDSAALPERAKLRLENREIKLEANHFSDEFTAFEPHVYELQGAE